MSLDPAGAAGTGTLAVRSEDGIGILDGGADGAQLLTSPAAG